MFMQGNVCLAQVAKLIAKTKPIKVYVCELQLIPVCLCTSFSSYFAELEL